MANVFLETAQHLKKVAEQQTAILVAFSGGKDSRAVLDLCCHAFQTVVCFHMYFVPGLRCIDEQLAIAKERYHCEIVWVPHWTLSRCLRNGIFCPNYFNRDDMPEWKLADVHRIVREDTGIYPIAHGGKLTDSLWRRRQLGNKKKFAGSGRSDTEGVIYPIKEWSKYDVLAYLAKQKIPVPEGDSESNSGVDLATPSILWLHDKYPDDFARMEKVFPYISAVVARRTLYGVK